MTTIFCCGDIRPYRPQHLSHESKFTSFVSWARYPKDSVPSDLSQDALLSALQSGTYVIQLVRQVNFGPLESKRYFAATAGTSLVEHGEFVEIQERSLIEANYQKLNSYKNYKCAGHNKFFELNVYEKDPVNKHHWRINVARPGSEIDI